MSTVEEVQRHVIDELLRGGLAPGAWVRQDALAARLGVSKIPVREALHRLAASGLLTFESNRGVRVPGLTAAGAEEVFALREALEPVLLRQAIPRMTTVDLATAALALSEPGDSPTAANWAFHRALYAPSGWARGMAIVEGLFVQVAPYHVVYRDDLGAAPQSDAEHVALLDACRDGDGDAAAAILRGHMSQARSALRTHLEDEEPTT